jgi:hypothetical protein
MGAMPGNSGERRGGGSRTCARQTLGAAPIAAIVSQTRAVRILLIMVTSALWSNPVQWIAREAIPYLL